MKKILLLIFTFLFSFTIYAKERNIGIKIYTINDEIKCNNIKMHVVNYNYSTNELIVSENYSDDSSEYYVINEKNECRKIKNKDWLDLYNSTQVYYSTYKTDFNEDLQDSSFAIIEYKKKVGLTTSYIKNEKDYNKLETYYEIIDNTLTEVKYPDKDRVLNYYIKTSLINVNSEKLNKDKDYYILDEDTGLLKKKSNEDVSILDIYELSNEKIEVLNTYSKSEDAASRLLNKYKENDNDQIIINIILDELYYGIFFYDEDNNLIKVKYYGDYYNEIKEFQNKIFYNYEDYLIASNINKKEYYIYDKKFNLIDILKFKTPKNIESIYDSNKKIFFTLKDEEGNLSSYSIKVRTNKYFYVLVFFDIIIVSFLIYLLVMRKKYKNRIKVFEEARLEEYENNKMNNKKKETKNKSKKH